MCVCVWRVGGGVVMSRIRFFIGTLPFVNTVEIRCLFVAYLCQCFDN